MASRNETGDSGTKASPPAFISPERIASWTPIGSLSKPPNGFPSTLASRSPRRSGAAAKKIASWKAIATWRSWSTTQSPATSDCSATSAAMFSGVSAVSRPASWKRARTSATMARIRFASAVRACAIRLAASGTGAMNGSMPFPQTYMRPGLPGSLTRVPASCRSSSTLMNSMPKSGRMLAARAASPNRA